MNRIGLTEAQRGGKSTSYNLVELEDIPPSTQFILNTVDITKEIFRSQIPMIQDHSSYSEQSTSSTNKRKRETDAHSTTFAGLLTNGTDTTHI